MNILISLTLIITLGTTAQWLAWRLRLPSIIILLLTGLAIGPLTGLLNPSEIFGDLLYPLVSLSVAIILFEGGLGLNFKDLAGVGAVVRNLVTIGAGITWILSTLCAHYFLEVSWGYALLLSAILVVTGPTVIGPILRQLRLSGPIAPILKWEGIIIDPIGATLAVLVFGIIIAGGFETAISITLKGLLITIIAGGLAGFIAAFFLTLMLRHYWIPDHLQSPFALMMVVIVFTISNHFQAESGLLAVVVMGMILANQKAAKVKKIIEFKENLRVLLISSVFILLAAHIQFSDLAQLDINVVYFLMCLIFMVRPLSVFISTLGSKLQLKEILILAWMAPRGIVAAAISSVFAFELIQHGYHEFQNLASMTFVIIIGTVSIYSLTLPWISRLFGLSTPNPQGILFIGAHAWAREIAKTLKEEGITTLLIDTNYFNISKARMEGLTSEDRDILSQSEVMDIELAGIGRLLAITPNTKVNTLAALRFSSTFGASNVYQLIPNEKNLSENTDHLMGRFLFSKSATFSHLDNLFHRKAILKKTTLTKEFDFEDFKSHNGENFIPLFLITTHKELIIYTLNQQPVPQPGQKLLSIILESSSD